MGGPPRRYTRRRGPLGRDLGHLALVHHLCFDIFSIIWVYVASVSLHAVHGERFVIQLVVVENAGAEQGIRDVRTVPWYFVKDIALQLQRTTLLILAFFTSFPFQLERVSALLRIVRTLF
jgi:hypothetical protein